MGQKDSGDVDPLSLILDLFWRRRVAKGTLQSFISGILLKWNGVSFPAVLTIVHSREGFSSWNRCFHQLCLYYFRMNINNHTTTIGNLYIGNILVILSQTVLLLNVTNHGKWASISTINSSSTSLSSVHRPEATREQKGQLWTRGTKEEIIFLYFIIYQAVLATVAN